MFIRTLAVVIGGTLVTAALATSAMAVPEAIIAVL